MLDIERTLAPESGVVSGWMIDAPDDQSPMWSVTVDLGERAGSSRLVGAQGIERGSSLVRAAGEAVERFALLEHADGPAVTIGRRSDLNGGALDFAGESLGDPAAEDEVLRWLEGKWLDTGMPVLVPAGLIDFPVCTPWFDDGPSGAAAGPSVEFAVRAALLEIIERDAVMVAWARRAPLRAVDLDAALDVSGPCSRDVRGLRRLVLAARRLGQTPHVFDVPTRSGLPCLISVVMDDDGPTAVGAKAHPDRGRALLVAVQESIQVLQALRRSRTAFAALDTPRLVRTDAERARVWMQPQAQAEMLLWIGGAAPASVEPLPPAEPEPDSARLSEVVRAEGGRPLVVDLTTRLPATHQTMGWHAVKVVVPGLQPLRIDESLPFTWRPGRAVDGAGPPLIEFPHPLI